MKLNVVLYIIMILGFVRVGNIVEVGLFFEWFKGSGGVFDFVCYNVMIEGLSSGNRVVEVYVFFEEMWRRGLSIYSKMCVVFLDVLYKSDCFE